MRPNQPRLRPERPSQAKVHKVVSAMKNNLKYIIPMFGVAFLTFLNLGADVPLGYIWKNSLLDIHTTTPPALMYVQDSSGRRTGGNPSLPVNSVGRQGRVLS